MEIWQAIGNLSPGVAVGVLCLYFYNQVTIKYLDERKEMLQNQAIERKEWNEALRQLNQQHYDLQRLAIESMTKMGAEMHALRNKLTEIMASIDNQLRGLENRIRGGGND